MNLFRYLLGATTPQGSIADTQRRRAIVTEERLARESMKTGGQHWDGHRLRLQNRAEHVGEVIARPFSRLASIEARVRGEV